MRSIMDLLIKRITSLNSWGVEMFRANSLANSAALSRNVASMLVSPVRKPVLDQFANTIYPSNWTQDFLQALDASAPWKTEESQERNIDFSELLRLPRF